MTRIARLLVAAPAVLALIVISMSLAPPAAAVARQQGARDLETVFREQAIEAIRHATPEAIQRAKAQRDANPSGKLAGAEGATASMVGGGFTCFPSCDPADGRFLVIANGAGFITLSDPVLNIEFAVPAGTPSFEIGIFDGDAGGTDGAGNTHWDNGAAAPYEYTLFADPNNDSTGTTVVELVPGMTTLPSTAMANNAWTSFTVATGAAAQAPSGNYFYRLNIRLANLSFSTLNAFKVRTDGVVTLEVPQQPFSYIANWTSLADITIVYPSFPSTSPTTYDGTFSFFLDVPQERDEIFVWGGDFDRGKWDGTDKDTDDPDTPGAPFLPPWATVDTVPEGVAVGTGLSSGSPADDVNGAGFGAFLLRTPSVRWDFVFPGGPTFANDNPSGNQEWEQFKVSTAPFDPSVMDYAVSNIPPGVYEVRLQGVDMQNLNAILMPGRVLCRTEAGVSCVALRPYLVGDTVFRDNDGDGNQDAGEPGIAGVVVDLLDPFGNVVASTTTDADGHYSFEADPGQHTVEVAAENFAPGGALEGFFSTTGDSITDTVIDDNRLDYDFGYLANGSIGDRVWFDADGDGFQDAGEEGLNGVIVLLLDGNGDVVATAVTSGDGDYLFDGLPAGTYTVVVEASSLPSGLQPTFDADGLVSLNRTTLDLGPGEDRTDIDFGYDECGPCQGKVTQLLFQYNGDSTAQVRVVGRRGPGRDEVFDDLVAPGGIFLIVGPNSGNGGFYGTLGTEISIYVDGAFHTMIHTSCSVPIGPGLVSGDFEVLWGTSRRGGLLCPLTAP